MTAGKSAVLMLGFGGPTSFEEVRPFIENVVAGRRVPPERIDAVVEQYRAIGGKSPFVELTMAQAGKLAESLKASDCAMPVYLGTLYGQPSIEDALSQIVAAHITRVVVVVMAPHQTEASHDRYLKGLQGAIAKLNADLDCRVLEPWHTDSLFISALANRIENSLKSSANGHDKKTKLVFTAHSVPVEMSLKSGYAEQINETARLVCQRLQHAQWTVAFQSRSGSPSQPWLEPDISQTIVESGKQGFNRIVVMPAGFVCDHVEVLYDLDVLAASVARQEGIEMLRAETVGCHPDFIAMLSGLVKQKACNW